MHRKAHFSSSRARLPFAYGASGTACPRKTISVPDTLPILHLQRRHAVEVDGLARLDGARQQGLPARVDDPDPRVGARAQTAAVSAPTRHRPRSADTAAAVPPASTGNGGSAAGAAAARRRSSRLPRAARIGRRHRRRRRRRRTPMRRRRVPRPRREAARTAFVDASSGAADGASGECRQPSRRHR